jgi:hypothetical protein
MSSRRARFGQKIQVGRTMNYPRAGVRTRKERHDTHLRDGSK